MALNGVLSTALFMAFTMRTGASPSLILALSHAQVMLRWALQRGCVVLPKSTNEDRIKENIGIFDFHISEQDMSTLNSFNAGLATGW